MTFSAAFIYEYTYFWVQRMQTKEQWQSKKPSAEKYDTKLAVNGTFADVIKASVIPMATPVQPKEGEA